MAKTSVCDFFLKKKQVMSDHDILYDFFFASRYITKDVRDRYGLNTSLYNVKPSFIKMKMLHEKLSEYIRTSDTIHVSSCEDLKVLLGDEFDWVNFSYPY